MPRLQKTDVKEDEDSDAESDSDDSSDSDSDSDSEEESDESKEAPKKRKAEEEPAANAKKAKTETETADNSPNLFVGNLSWNVDEEWLRREFEQYGELAGVRIMTERDTGRSRG